MSKAIRSTTLVVFVALVLVVALSAAAVHADTIIVCWDGGGDYFTIQEGINAAVNGDEVVVCDGTYTGDNNRDLDFLGKVITVRSENGPENCIIDCEGSETDPHRGFRFHCGETAAAVVEGFTIINGLAGTSSPGGERGGGMLIETSGPTLANCTFRENSAEYGGGLFSHYGSPTLIDCTFDYNIATASAGGLYNYGYPGATLIDCAFNENSAEDNGGGMRNWDSNPTITGCIFYYNHVRYSGAGMANGGGSSPLLTDCFFHANRTDTMFGMWDSYGGGMSNFEDSAPTLVNCTFLANSAHSLFPALSHGGAMANGGNAGPMLTNCTFSGNHADVGFGLYNKDYSIPTVTNSILWDYQDEIVIQGGATISITYSDVRGAWPGVGNICDDPLLDNLRLQPGSPCIDTGDPAFTPEPCQTDMDGEMRVWDGDTNGIAVVDMGADEFGSHSYGDLNCDGELNAFDIDPFVLALTDPAGYAATYPDCDRMLADCNCDGLMDAFDIDPFVELLTGG